MIISNPKEVKLNFWVELCVFISAYFPLFLILFIRDINNSNDINDISINFLSLNISFSYFSIINLFLSILACIIVKFIFKFIFTGKDGSISIKIESVKLIRGDMINYTLPFLIGLFAFDYKTWQSTSSLFIFLFFMFLFAKKDQIILLNPMFLLMDIRLYEIKYTEFGREYGSDITVLCIGQVIPSATPVRLKENAGINFIYSSPLNRNQSPYVE